MSSYPTAEVVLEDGTIFSGTLHGAKRSISGEVVFNTGMVGYPEAITDPSYKGQILTFTYPLIGNYGVPANDSDDISESLESLSPKVQAVLVTDYNEARSHWSAAQTLGDWLDEHDVPLVSGIDTRALTQHLRDKGVMLGKVIYKQEPDYHDPNSYNVVSDVSTDDVTKHGNGSTRIVCVDCGMKHNIIRNFIKRDCQVIRVPWDYDFTELDYDGLFVSNGPGDPAYCKRTIEHIDEAMQHNIPIFGICLGNQLMGMASGAKSFKLKHGHRSQNQPCKEVGTERCLITSQNHGFALRRQSLSDRWNELYVNANDGTNEGIEHTTKPFFAVQFHPEHSPGPRDAESLFDRFLKEVRDG